MNDIFLERLDVESAQDWRGWCFKIPPIKIPANVKLKITPPYGGAMVRFCMEKDNKEYLSGYLDCFYQLGCYGGPYWDAYPWEGDTIRFAMDDVEGLEKILREWSEK